MRTRSANQQAARANKNASSFLIVLILLVAALVIVLYTCRRQKAETGSAAYKKNNTVPAALHIPAVKPSDQIIEHKGYTLSFNPSHEQATWVAYVLRGDQLQSAHFSRTNQFMTDPLAKPHSADDEDYEGSGYDRGHLAAAEDMSWSATTMKESFYYTNMSPQVPSFNRGVWKRLEELVRYWASAYDSICVVTGPVLRTGLPAIGPDRVSVPEYFYKVALQYNPKGVQGVGFVLRNEASAALLKSFAVSIDSVEHLTGIDFYPQLPDDEEEKIESRLNENHWLWQRTKAKQE